MRFDDESVIRPACLLSTFSFLKETLRAQSAKKKKKTGKKKGVRMSMRGGRRELGGSGAGEGT